MHNDKDFSNSPKKRSICIRFVAVFVALIAFRIISFFLVCFFCAFCLWLYLITFSRKVD